MTIHRLDIYLSDGERSTLQAFATRERRAPRSQAVLLINDGLQRAGLLSDESPMAEEQTREVRDVH